MTDFRVVYFDEVKDPYQITLLLQLSLYFTATPEHLAQMRKNDDRYTPEFGVFAVTPEGKVTAGHLLMQIPTETVKGRLDVGGVNAVATRPDFARKGIMSAVMSKAHEYFIDRDLEYSYLTTSNRLVAAGLYEKLGYVELDRSRCAAKYPNQSRLQAPAKTNVRSGSEDDRPTVDEIFRKVVAGSYGFVHRPKDFLRARAGMVDREVILSEKLRIVEKDKQPTGYAYWELNPRFTEATELIAHDRDSFRALLAEAETRTPNSIIWVWCDGLTKRESDWFKDTGYEVPIESYGRAVIKDLKKKNDSLVLRKLYGVERGEFRWGVWDGT
jgi:GNAT superfamily N-acetyltransferase